MPALPTEVAGCLFLGGGTSIANTAGGVIVLISGATIATATSGGSKNVNVCFVTDITSSVAEDSSLLDNVSPQQQQQTNNTSPPATAATTCVLQDKVYNAVESS